MSKRVSPPYCKMNIHELDSHLPKFKYAHIEINNCGAHEFNTKQMIENERRIRQRKFLEFYTRKIDVELPPPNANAPFKEQSKK